MGWREEHAPYGFLQLAQKLGMSPADLEKNPQLVASAVAHMEDPQGANYVGESFMDMVDRNGGGVEGLRKTIPAYDTMTMRTGRTIGKPGDRNSTIAGINPDTLAPTVDHLNNVASGKEPRILEPGRTQNFSPAAARVQPVRDWHTYTSPSGERVYSPSWASEAITKGAYTKTPSGEYMVANNGEGDFKPTWSSGATAGPDGAFTPPGPTVHAPVVPPILNSSSRQAQGAPPDTPTVVADNSSPAPSSAPSEPSGPPGAFSLDGAIKGLGPALATAFAQPKGDPNASAQLSAQLAADEKSNAQALGSDPSPQLAAQMLARIKAQQQGAFA